MAEGKQVIVKVKRQASRRKPPVGGVCFAVAGVDERDYLPARYCGEACHSRGQAYDPVSSIPIVWKSVWFVRDVNQWQSAHGLFRFGRSIWSSRFG